MHKLLFLGLIMLINPISEFFSTSTKENPEQSLDDYKCLFIENFVKNIDWGDGQKIIKVGVLGNSPILPKLTKRSNGTNFSVQKIGFINQINKFDIVFIPKSQSASINSVKTNLKSNNILLIAENETIAQKVDLCFYIDGGKLKFMVNSKQLENKELKLSSKLLSFGKKI